MPATTRLGGAYHYSSNFCLEKDRAPRHKRPGPLRDRESN
jgi:hypothetical protein